MVARGAHVLQAEEVLELIEDKQHRGPKREADDDRLRNVARQVAEAEERDARLRRANQKGEQNRRRNLLIAWHERQRAEYGDGDRIGWSVDELTRRVEEGPDRRHDDRG